MSAYVYIVWDARGDLIGAWTDKDELAGWLGVDRPGAPPRTALVEITRVVDGQATETGVALNPYTLERAM